MTRKLVVLAPVLLLLACPSIDKGYVTDLRDQYAFIERGYGRILDDAQTNNKPGYDAVTVQNKKNLAASINPLINDLENTKDVRPIEAKFLIIRPEYEQLLDEALAAGRPEYDKSTVKTKKLSCVSFQKLLDVVKE